MIVKSQHITSNRMQYSMEKGNQVGFPDPDRIKMPGDIRKYLMAKLRMKTKHFCRNDEAIV
ncbi:MAG: hypothetical protein IPJ64_00855 [Saprospiraceae bacterium]|jgi:hypothetical protein|nr:hypothetical protein [Saprospiraceae bacterium]MBK7794916.1 hypothetical protein [Saprospiraceae bacterium]